MIFKNIYEKIQNDFGFVNNYGFYYEHDFKHSVHPSAVFKKGLILMQIGYNYENHKIFVILSDPNENRYPNKENLDKIAKLDPERLELFNKGIPKFKNLLDKEIILGKKYDEQVDSVKLIVLNYLKSNYLM